MTPGEISQVVTACAALVGSISSICAVAVSLRNGRKMDRVEQATDGIVTKLSDSKLAQGDAEGHARGDAEGHARGLEEGRKE